MAGDSRVESQIAQLKFNPHAQKCIGKRFLIGNALDARLELASVTWTGLLASTLDGRSAYILRQSAARISVSRRPSIVGMSTLSDPELHEYMTRARARRQTSRHLPPVLSTLEEL